MPSRAQIPTHAYLTCQVLPSARSRPALFEDNGADGGGLVGEGEGGRVVREALSDQVPCEQGPEGREGASSIDLRGASTSARVS